MVLAALFGCAGLKSAPVRALLILLCFLSVSCLSAQGMEVDSDRATGEGRFGVHLMPLSVMNLRARYRLGALYQTGGRLTYLLDLEYGGGRTPRLFFGDRNPVDRFVGLRPELRRSFLASPDRKQADPYLSLELPVTYFEVRVNDPHYVREDGTHVTYDYANRQRLRITLIAKGGVVVFLGDHLYFDVYAGLGGGGRRVTYRDQGTRRPVTRRMVNRWPVGAREAAVGWRRIVDAAAGFRVGYLF
jgi:hypothetical protein